ncbi:MAG TPA: acyl-CoA dehydrogenase family protein [Leptospiraceae bacterium]|nr:acyl-CoA dehydrogenase family protein [Leptospiraceae bacterium]
MIKNNYFSDNPDIMLHFESIINWAETVRAYEGDFEDYKKYQSGDERFALAVQNTEEAVNYYREILNSAGDIAGRTLSQAASEIEKKGLRFENGKVFFPSEMEDAVAKIREAGLIPNGFGRQYGGLGIPFAVKAFFGEVFYRADVSTTVTAFCVNLAEILEKHASQKMKEEWLPQLSNGHYTVSMGLTEPNHGSDLPNILTKAEKKEDGTWILNGTKRFITQACGFTDMEGIILTLARTGGNGARGLSFFLVKSSDVQIASLERKMGMHSSPTCEVVLENSPGLLIGEEGHGLSRYVIGMLNGARINIAFEGTGIASAAYYEAEKYAKERIQFGKPIIEIPAVKKILRRMHREMLAMRCVSLEGARSVDMYHWREERLKSGMKIDIPEEELKFWEKIASILTPAAKYYCSETCNKIAYDAVQVHGGAGYTEDYDVSRIYRDARVASIYDGTSQIQVMAAIGGIMSGFSKNGHLKKYFSNLSAGFALSSEMKKILEMLEESVILYRSLPSSEAKEESAEDIVELFIRSVAGLLLEKSSVKAGQVQKTERLKTAELYNRDTYSSGLGKIFRLKEMQKS